jgi:3-hydroxyisobutyrate dehydrogenase-like beta-hydroxyacid dehydrogenase
MRIGFIGLGDQGAPMVAAIARAGFEVNVWARRPESYAFASDVKPVVCSSVADVGRRSDFVGLCLREDRNVEEVVFHGGLLDALEPGSVLANHGTGSPDVCEDWAQRCMKADVYLLDAPVSGGRVGAENRTLTTMVGGDACAFESYRQVFEAFSRLVVYLGAPGSGQLVKLINNTLTAANLKNSEETLALCEQLGLDKAAVAELVQFSSGANFAMEALSKQMTPALGEHYTKMLGKDVAHLSQAARLRGIPETALEESARQGVAGIIDTVNRLHEGLVPK